MYTKLLKILGLNPQWDSKGLLNWYESSQETVRLLEDVSLPNELPLTKSYKEFKTWAYFNESQVLQLSYTDGTVTIWAKKKDFYFIEVKTLAESRTFVFLLHFPIEELLYRCEEILGPLVSMTITI